MDTSEELEKARWELTKLLYASLGAITMGRSEDALKLIKEEKEVSTQIQELIRR